VIDSGATIHATSRKDFFTSYTSGNFGVVKMGNNKLSKIIGKGDIILMMENGLRLVLKDVSHVANKGMNLISVSRLDDEGFCNTFKDGTWKLTRGALVIARGLKHSMLYVTHAKISNCVVNTVEKDDTIALCHKRLGHIGEKVMAKLIKEKVVREIYHVHLKGCHDFLVGKQNQVAFKSSQPSRKENILDLVYSDLCGLLKRSLGGGQYFVTFIDDHSRKTWVYILNKDYVLDVFKQHHALVERETGKKLKCIWTDNGGEYIGAFDAYCKTHGIRHQMTPPKTP